MKVARGFSRSEEFCPVEKQIRQKAELLFPHSANERRGSYSWMPGWNTLSVQFLFLDTPHSAVSITVRDLKGFELCGSQ